MAPLVYGGKMFWGCGPTSENAEHIMDRTSLLVTATFLAVIPRVAGPLPAAEAPAPAVLIDTDFSVIDKARMNALPAHERVRGMLPDGWSDDSSWAKVWVSYRVVTQPGRRFFRAEVTRLDDGRAQFHHLIPDFTETTYFRLTMTARSRTASSAEVGIRMAGEPYRFLWRTNLALPRDWRDYTSDFKLSRNRQPVGLWINLGSVGSIDLSAVRLVRMTREQLLAELKARYAGAGPRNLLRNTRMPLGLQSGWSLDRDSSDGDDVRIAADEKVVGPSGAAALSIRSARPARLTTAPFAAPRAFAAHVASVYVRGKGKVHLGVLGGRRLRGPAGSAEPTGGGWKRLSARFMPELLRRFYALRLGCEGEVWIDALQVESGDEPGPYVSQLDCEVALAVESPARVQFDDEPAAVRYAVTGKAAGAVLKAKVVTPYGAAKDLPPVPLAGGFLRKGELRYDVFPDRPYGVFRVEARVDGADGRPISPPNELVVFRLRRPRYWMKDGHNSAFGTHTLSTTRHILMAKAIGVNWTRLHDAGTRYIGWYHLEPKKGQWSFRDRELKRYRRYGMKIVAPLSTAPRWASHFSHEKPHSGYFDRFYQPLRMADFAHYVRTVAERYSGGVIDTWDVWNEPWIHAWWAVDYDETQKGREGYETSSSAQADFARLMATACKAVKAVDPNATVLGVNSTTHSPGGRNFGGSEWTRGVVEAGGLDHCDAIAYHDYTGAVRGYPGDDGEKGFETAVGPIIEKLGRCRRAVWMTEGSSIGGIIGDGFYNHTLPYAPTEDVFDTSDRLCRYLVSLLGQGVRKIFLYSMHCHGYFGTTEYRVLLTPEGYLHPCAAALSTTAWLLDETKFVKRLSPREGVTAYLFEGRGRATAVLSPMPGHAPYVPPRAKGVEVLDLFGNPVGQGQKLRTRLLYLSTPGGTAKLEKLLAP